MTLNPGMLSSNNEHLCTPPEVLELVERFGPIALDPCSNSGSFVRSEERFTVEDDGLAQPWYRDGRTNFVNPPYGKKLPAWFQKCTDEYMLGATVVGLVPFRPGTKAWQSIVFPRATAIVALKGRVQFYDPETRQPVQVWSKKEQKWKATKAPFDSALVIWDSARDLDFFEYVFRDVGTVLIPHRPIPF